MSVKDACVQIAAVVGGVTGIRYASDTPPENNNTWPIAVVFPLSGNQAAGPIGTRRGLHNIVIDVLIAKQQSTLPRRLEFLVPLLDSIPAALLAEVTDSGDRFSSTIDTFAQINYQWIPITDYTGTPCEGYRFTMTDVKILS